jgi:acyl-CoA thioesterase FadM
VLHEAARTVRFQEVDASARVSTGKVLEFFHDAYADFLATRGLDLARAVREGGWGAPIVHAEADFRAPLAHGDAIAVAIEGARVGARSIAVDYAIRREGAVVARGRLVSAFVDRRTFGPREVPDEIRAAFTEASRPPGAPEG